MNNNEVEYEIIDGDPFAQRPAGRVYYKETIKSTVSKGISFGSCLAMVISFTSWHSIPWAIFHGLLGWIYVVYYAIVY